jgi:hypothetical protein
MLTNHNTQNKQKEAIGIRFKENGYITKSRTGNVLKIYYYAYGKRVLLGQVFSGDVLDLLNGKLLQVTISKYDPKNSWGTK